MLPVCTFSSWSRGYLVTVTSLWAGRPAQRFFFFCYEYVDRGGGLFPEIKACYVPKLISFNTGDKKAWDCASTSPVKLAHRGA